MPATVVDCSALYKPSPKQAAAHADRSRVVLARGAWRSGKTTFSLWQMILTGFRALERGRKLRLPGAPAYLMLRKTGPALADTLLKDFDEYCPPELVVDKRDSVGRIERVLQGGIRYLFRSMDDWRKFGGGSYDGGLLDEGWEFTEIDFDQVRGRMSGKWGPGQVVICTNPPNRSHWIYKRFVQKKEPGFSEHHFTTYDNAANLTPEYLADLEQMDEVRKRRFVYGEWGFTSDNTPVFPEFRELTHVADLRFHAVPKAFLICGWDFGWHHPAVVIAQVLPTGHVNLLREQLGDKIDVRVFGRQVLNLLERDFPGVPVIHYCDAAGVQKNDLGTSSVIELRKLGIKFRYRKLGLMRTIDQMRELVKTLHLGVPLLRADRAGCPLTVEALCGGYGMDPEKDEPCKDGFYDHLVDATRYAVVPAVYFSGGGLEAIAAPSRNARVSV